jgi:TMEM175 potassium channel family protein
MAAVSTSRDPDRLVLFTDAVVAIAITLLVLPLVDVVSESVAEHHTSVEVVTEHWPQIFSFLLSFAVIAQYWLTHHRMFEGVKAYSRSLTLWNLLWLLTIVVLPFPTEMVGVFSDDVFTTLLYIGTILVSSVCLGVLTLIIHGDPEVGHDPAGLTAPTVIRAVTPTVLLGVAFLLSWLVPGMSYYSLLLLLLNPVVERVLRIRAVSQ